MITKAQYEAAKREFLLAQDADIEYRDAVARYLRAGADPATRSERRSANQEQKDRFAEAREKWHAVKERYENQTVDNLP